MKNHVKYIFIALNVSILISGCSGLNLDPTKGWSPQQFYAEGKSAMKIGNYDIAVHHFETLEARFPYGRYAEQAQLEIAYAYFKNDEPALAVSAINRFIKMHPTHESVDYAYYLKGIISFQGQGTSILKMMGKKLDPSDHDAKAAKESYDSFKNLIRRFPKSRYVGDAKGRMRYLFDAMARHEIKVAKFYYERKAYIAAANRCKYVLEHFQHTKATEDALGLQALSYKQLGLKKLYSDTLRVLKKNFPKSPYLDDIKKLRLKLG